MAAGASQCIFFLYDHAMTGADQSKIDHAGVVVCAPAWACTRLRGSGGGHPGMYYHLPSAWGGHDARVHRPRLRVPYTHHASVAISSRACIQVLATPRQLIPADAEAVVLNLASEQEAPVGPLSHALPTMQGKDILTGKVESSATASQIARVCVFACICICVRACVCVRTHVCAHRKIDKYVGG